MSCRSDGGDPNIVDAVHDAERLKELQALPLDRKIQITQARIIEWYEHYNGQVCVSFSGGKDSTVLLHIARRLYPNIPAVFSNTGLEYSSIQRFVKTWDNVDIVVPKMRFDEVVSTYGYPLIGKEVAEAIYYARRPFTVSSSRETERRGAICLGCNHYLQKESGSTGRQTEWKRLEIGGGQNPNLIKTGTARNRRTILQGRWGKAGVVKPTGNGSNLRQDIQEDADEPG